MKKPTKPNPSIHKNLPAYRASLNAKLGRDAIEFGRCLCHLSKTETALFYMLHAIEDLAEGMQQCTR